MIYIQEIVSSAASSIERTEGGEEREREVNLPSLIFRLYSSRISSISSNPSGGGFVRLKNAKRDERESGSEQ